MSRRTIARPVSLEGVGVHYGASCRLSFLPAPSGTGVVFRRVDIPDRPMIPALIDVAVPVAARTQLGTDPVSIHTPEHVLAAVVGCHIDDIVIEMDGSEPPIMDGSAAAFVDALHSAGIVEHEGDVQYFTLTRPVSVSVDGATYEALPAPNFEVSVAIHFDHPAIGMQRGCYRVTPESFVAELARARTFGFRKWLAPLLAQGLARGTSLENTIVLEDDGGVSGDLRWADEFVRHKALDCVGDFALAGGRIRARINAVRPSHRGNVKLVQAMKEAMAKETSVLGIEDIMKVLPHRYPFLLVDRILEIEAGKRIVGLKNVTINEPFFQGHFPGHPIMPGVLIIEAMAQVGGMLLMGAVPDPGSKVVYFTSLNNVKWRQPVKPGDQLRFELELLQVRGMMCKMSGVAKVDGKVVAEAEMGAVVREK
ncbi:MAG TPA: UDP-3-O-acyl-N-acetylglucosamine deacetylase [Gemmatimonadaceae bacterium]|nr:UDP-3-O-acyl-N-acetylglucosamine deacetylase [Gemmatimonadaceae bacterium]